jgi:activator of HSP90 ATPase
MPTNANSARATQSATPAAATNAAPTVTAVPDAAAVENIINGQPTAPTEATATAEAPAAPVELDVNLTDDESKKVNVKDVIKNIMRHDINRTSKVYEREVFNTNFTIMENYTRVSITLSAPVRSFVLDEETGEYELGNNNVIFSSTFGLVAAIREANPSARWATNRMLEDTNFLHQVISDAKIRIFQRLIPAGEEFTSIFNGKTNEAYDHDIIVNDVYEVILGKEGESFIKLEKVKSMGISIDISALL